MTAPVVLCDVDGVLADFIGAVCRELGNENDYRPSLFRHWDLSKTLTPSELEQVHSLMMTQGFCLGLEWYPHAWEFFQSLVGLGETYALTSPFAASSTWAAERAAWLPVDKRRILSVPTEAKHLVRGDVLVEDHPGTCHRWLNANRSGIAILIDRPWNQPSASEYAPHARLHRTTSYAQAFITINDLSELRKSA